VDLERRLHRKTLLTNWTLVRCNTNESLGSHSNEAVNGSLLDSHHVTAPQPKIPSSKSRAQNAHLLVIINVTLLRFIIHTSILDRMCALHLGILNASSHSQYLPLLSLPKNGT
jgi:hypothetical protein